MQRRVPIALVAFAALVVGCGSDAEQGTPPACLSPAGAYLRALEDAPREVSLDGGTPISSCLSEGQAAGELAQVGDSVVRAATALNGEALRDPAGPATVQLGYLVGAVQQGAADTGGIHRDLVIRLDAAARFTRSGDSPPKSFERAFGRGYAAGQATG